MNNKPQTNVILRDISTKHREKNHVYFVIPYSLQNSSKIDCIPETCFSSHCYPRSINYTTCKDVPAVN